MSRQDRVELKSADQDNQAETRREWVDPEVVTIELSTAELSASGEA